MAVERMFCLVDGGKAKSAARAEAAQAQASTSTQEQIRAREEQAFRQASGGGNRQK